MTLFRPLKKIPIYPLILAVYPILAMLAANIDQIDPTAALRPILLSLLSTAILYGFLGAALKDLKKAALILGLGLGLFYTYGHLYNYLEINPILGIQLGRHRYLAPLWVILAAGGFWAIFKSKQISPAVIQAVTVSALVMLVFPVFQIAKTYYSYSLAARQNNPSILPGTVDRDLQGELPDVYLVILDMYARQDVLLEKYAFDNQGFINELEDLGFYVAKCSLSNYGDTQLSLTSLMNLDYIQPLTGAKPSMESKNYAPLIKFSSVRQQLADLGYQTIAFETGYHFSEISSADLYFSPPTISPTTAFLTPFEVILLDSTAVFPVMDLLSRQQLSQNIHYLHYIRELFVLEKLEEIPALPRNKFVFAHIISPHRPYIFLPDGSMQTDTDFYSGEQWGAVDLEHDRIGYSNQVAFLNSRMIPLLEKIIDQSANPPVILLFSDHGVYPNRNQNLAAYYLPGKGTERLYPTITSVNSFRLVFDLYFGGNYGMLPDISYENYSFSEYVDRQPACLP